MRDTVTGSGSIPAGTAGRTADAISGGHARAVLDSVPAGGARQAAQALVHESFIAGLDRICVISGVVALAAGVLVLAVVRGGPSHGAKPHPGRQERAASDTAAQTGTEAASLPA